MLFFYSFCSPAFSCCCNKANAAKRYTFQFNVFHFTLVCSHVHLLRCTIAHTLISLERIPFFALNTGGCALHSERCFAYFCYFLVIFFRCCSGFMKLLLFRSVTAITIGITSKCRFRRVTD